MGEMSGSGKYFTNDDTYIGNFYYNKPHGFCTHKTKTGDIYKGEWKHGVKHGHGEYKTTSTGAIFKGRWNKE